MVARDLEEEGMVSYYLIDIEFQFYKMKSMTDDGDGCTTLWMYLIPQNCTLKSG